MCVCVCVIPLKFCIVLFHARQILMPQPMPIVTITLFIFTTDRYCYIISISEIEAVLCLQAFSSVSAFPFAYYFLKIVVLHACQSV